MTWVLDMEVQQAHDSKGMVRHQEEKNHDRKVGNSMEGMCSAAWLGAREVVEHNQAVGAWFVNSNLSAHLWMAQGWLELLSYETLKEFYWEP